MKIIITIIILFSLSIIFFFKENNNNSELTPTIKIEKEVLVKKISEQNFKKTLNLSGFTEASRIVVLKSQVEGKVSSKYFKKGKLYYAGDQLVLIDPEDKVAKLKEMEALLNQRKKEYEVAENLFKKGFRSEVKLSESRTNFEKALALFEKSQVNLNNTKISLPFDSIIEESYVELGDYVKKGDPIAKIVDLDPIYININVTENEIENISKNKEANVSILGQEYKGFISFIAKTADPQTRNFRLQVQVSNPKNKIISGLSSEIKIEIKDEYAFFIPSSLVSLNNDGILGIKVINKKRVVFIPIDILSDTGSGYWIRIINNEQKKEILIISQGSEYVVVNEEVIFKLEEND